MSLAAKLRRGEGPFWGPLKRAARGVLSLHLPVFWLTRPLFRALYAGHVAVRHLAARLACFFWYEPLFRSQCTSVGRGLQMGPLPFIHGDGRIVLGDGVRFGGKPNFIFGNRGRCTPEVVIGDQTFIGHDCVFTVSEALHIGRHCLLASGVQISDYDGHPIDAGRRRAGEPTPPENIRAVTIGDDVWIGTSAIVLKGVRIGDRAIVGAGAVVTRDVPPDTLVAGNPARAVKGLPPPQGGALA